MATTTETTPDGTTTLETTPDGTTTSEACKSITPTSPTGEVLGKTAGRMHLDSNQTV